MALERRRHIFGRSAALYGADRGFFSEDNIAVLRGRRHRLGEHSAARRLHDAATPGLRTIGGLQARPAIPGRRRGMKRCRAEGVERFALFVGAAVLANNS